MAQGFLQSFDANLEVFSAGTEPKERVNPMAVKVMADVGIDISRHKPQNVNAFLNVAWDYVITVCSHANETCPMFAGKVKNKLHIEFDDPAKAVGSESDIENEFIRIRNEIKSKFSVFYSDLFKEGNL